MEGYESVLLTSGIVGVLAIFFNELRKVKKLKDLQGETRGGPGRSSRSWPYGNSDGNPRRDL